MELHIYKDAQAVSTAAATLIAARVIGQPDCVLGLATGSTPLATYRRLIELYRSGVVDFSRVTTFNLDEYRGLESAHPQSYHHFMQENLFRHVNVDRERIHIPSGNGDEDAVCRTYEEQLAQAGGIDLQLLGIGRNGHIAFNEPADHFPAATHIVELTASTIEANRRFFDSAEAVPRRAVTMGVGTILRARAILLLAAGADKADAIHAMVHGEITPRCPASALRLHPNTVVLLDEAAAARL